MRAGLAMFASRDTLSLSAVVSCALTEEFGYLSHVLYCGPFVRVNFSWLKWAYQVREIWLYNYTDEKISARDNHRVWILCSHIKCNTPTRTVDVSNKVFKDILELLSSCDLFDQS